MADQCRGVKPSLYEPLCIHNAFLLQQRQKNVKANMYYSTVSRIDLDVKDCETFCVILHFFRREDSRNMLYIRNYWPAFYRVSCARRLVRFGLENTYQSERKHLLTEAILHACLIYICSHCTDKRLQDISPLYKAFASSVTVPTVYSSTLRYARL